MPMTVEQRAHVIETIEKNKKLKHRRDLQKRTAKTATGEPKDNLKGEKAKATKKPKTSAKPPIGSKGQGEAATKATTKPKTSAKPPIGSEGQGEAASKTANPTESSQDQNVLKVSSQQGQPREVSHSAAKLVPREDAEMFGRSFDDFEHDARGYDLD